MDPTEPTDKGPGDTSHIQQAAISGATCSTSTYDYEEAVKALHNLQTDASENLKQKKNLEQIDAKRASKLSSIVKYLERSGLTMLTLDKLPVIHISGTKGKGSTCMFLERLLNRHGYKTGLFTSPHMVEVRERTRINGEPIDRELFTRYFWKVYNRLKETENQVGPEEGRPMPPYFCFLLVLSLHVFLSEGVDVAVLEVGIGGQHDHTNVVRDPLVCGVTSLGLDHTSILGNTIEDIAWHKAGIFKAHHPAVTVPQKPEAIKVILERAKERRSPVYVSRTMTPADLEKFGLTLGIAGEKQAENASLAIQLYHLFGKEKERRAKTLTQDISNPMSLATPNDIPVLEVTEVDDSTVTALRECRWPGRTQTLKKPGITYYLDGAHTIESMECCAKWFRQTANEEKDSLLGSVARVLIFNVTKNRNPEPMFQLLKTANFDAAVFCTNKQSTVDSANKADQLNKTVTQSTMDNIAQSNKACWDKLCAIPEPGAINLNNNNNYSSVSSSNNNNTHESSTQVSQVDSCANNKCDQSEPDLVDSSNLGSQDCGRGVSAVLPDSRRLSPQSSQARFISSSTNSSSNSFSSFNSNSSTNFSTDSIANSTTNSSLKDPTTNSSPQHNPNQLNSPSNHDPTPHNPKIEESTTTSPPCPNSVSGQSFQKNDQAASQRTDKESCSHPKPEEAELCSQPGTKEAGLYTLPGTKEADLCTLPGTKEVELYSQPKMEDVELCSQLFPCIMDALNWVTQGRDPTVTSPDDPSSVPPRPSCLRDAKHVQVLISGSLLLVGGVLAVIDPELKG